jgi:hypothetical protein
MRRVIAAVVAGVLLGGTLSACGEDDESTATAEAPRGFFGVVPQGAITDEDLARMEQGGIGTIRIVVPWGELDPSNAPGDTNFSSVDPVVLGAAQHGIRVVPTIYGTPLWAATELDGETDCDPDCPTYAPHSEAALDAWGGFIGEMVDRYGPGGTLWEENAMVEPVPVQAWQIWNEQNSPTFFRPDPDPDAYAQLLHVASTAIAKRDPKATVILGGMFGTPFSGKPPAYSAWEFLRKLYEVPGARDDFDGVAAHPYAAHFKKIEDQVSLLHDEVVRADDDAGLWITEVGASSAAGHNPLDRGPKGQAELLSESFELFLDQRVAWDIDAVTWYAWRDNTQVVLCDWCAHSGLFEESSLTPKPAWDAFVSFTGGS